MRKYFFKILSGLFMILAVSITAHATSATRNASRIWTSLHFANGDKIRVTAYGNGEVGFSIYFETASQHARFELTPPENFEPATRPYLSRGYFRMDTTGPSSPYYLSADEKHLIINYSIQGKGKWENKAVILDISDFFNNPKFLYNKPFITKGLTLPVTATTDVPDKMLLTDSIDGKFVAFSRQYRSGGSFTLLDGRQGGTYGLELALIGRLTPTKDKTILTTWKYNDYGRKMWANWLAAAHANLCKNKLGHTEE